MEDDDTPAIWWPPVQIETMLKCYYFANPPTQLGKLTPAQNDAVSRLRTNGLIDELLKPTDRGRAFVSLICRTPLPVEQTQWTDPRNGKFIAG